MSAHWSEVEALGAADARRIQDERLREQLEYVAVSSAFYRSKFGEHGVDLTTIRSVDDLQRLPFTEKQELRDSLADAPPLGHHVAAAADEIVQIQASSGTTGSPSYVGLTARRGDMARARRPCPVRQRLPSGRSCASCVRDEQGVRRRDPRGSDPPAHGNGRHPDRRRGRCGSPPARPGRPAAARADRHAVLPRPTWARKAAAIVGRPAHELGVATISVGGEPGGGLPAVRDGLKALWGATVREMLGGTDIACMYWGECETADGMHFLSPDLMVAELIDPATGERVAPIEGAEGELVYTALRRQASPLVRFRTRDHVVVTGTSCACGRTGYKIRCVGRTDDMLIVRGINVFPSAIKALVLDFMPQTTGEIRIRAAFEGHSTQRPLPLVVEHASDLGAEAQDRLRASLESRVRSALNVKCVVELVPEGTLERPDHVKVELVERVPRSG